MVKLLRLLIKIKVFNCLPPHKKVTENGILASHVFNNFLIRDFSKIIGSYSTNIFKTVVYSNLGAWLCARNFNNLWGLGTEYRKRVSVVTDDTVLPQAPAIPIPNHCCSKETHFSSHFSF